MTIVLFVAIAVTWFALSLNRLETPPPLGLHSVGRVRINLIDDQRPERFKLERRREVIIEAWYPAKKGSGVTCPYFPELAAISGALVESGQLSSIESWGLSQVRSHAQCNAEFAAVVPPCPVVLLSPGNATNVELYSAIGEELASRGYIVLGVNHPYDVGAVRLHDGFIANYQQREFGDQAALRSRMLERVADIRFLFDSLVAINAGDHVLSGHLDLSRIAVIGHSLGGLTAAEFCAVDTRPIACVNLDGLYFDNPYGASAAAKAPPQPFLYLGKEKTINDRTRELLARHKNAKLVGVAEATHESFQDGCLFEPTLRPWDQKSRRTLERWRSQLVEFLDAHLMLDARKTDPQCSALSTVHRAPVGRPGSLAAHPGVKSDP